MNKPKDELVQGRTDFSMIAVTKVTVCVSLRHWNAVASINIFS